MFLKSWLWKNSPESWRGSTDCYVLRRFAYISSLVHAQPLVGMCCCTHFTDEKIKSQGGEVTHSRSNSQVVTELGFKLSSFCLHYPGPYPPSSPHFRLLWSLVRWRSRTPMGGPRGSGVWRSQAAPYSVSGAPLPPEAGATVSLTWNMLILGPSW